MRFLKAFIIFLFIFLTLPVNVFAQTPNFLGQNHKYSVVFRGNGEAIVSMRAVLTNLSDSPISKISLKIPSNISVNDLIAYQVFPQGRCLQYDYTQASPTEKLQTKPTFMEPYPCINYEDVNFDTFSYSYNTNTKYEKIQSENSNQTIDLTLSKPISKEKSGSYFIYFRAMGYANKNMFGSSDINFETLKVEDKIQNLTVGISTDSDLYLKNAQGNVNYNPTDTKTNLSFGSIAQSAPEMSPQTVSQFNNFYNNIGIGSLYKTASNLSPNESYTVKGQYADATWKLYFKEALIGISILLLVIVAVVGICIAIYKSVFNKKSVVVNPTNKKASIIIAVSFVQSLSIGLLTFVLVLAFNFVGKLPFSYIGGGISISIILVMCMLVIAFMLYAGLLFGPVLIIGQRYGAGWAIATFFLSIIWIILFAVIFTVGYFLIVGNQNQIYPMYSRGVTEPAQAPGSMPIDVKQIN